VDAVQLVMHSSPYCNGCPAGQLCHEQTTAQGCSPWGPPHPNLLRPAQSDWLSRFAEVDGLGFDTVQADNQALPDLPRYTPRTRLDADIRDNQGIPAIAVSLCEVQRLAAKVRERGVSARALLGLPEDAKLVVLGFESDAFLEQAWPKPRRRQILEAILEAQPDLAVAWGYSVWYRHTKGWAYPRIEQLFNMKRSLITYADLQRAGIPAAPHVYWGNHEDLRRWCRWLADNPSVSTIAVDLQTADADGDWQTALYGLTCLRQNLGHHVRILINGPCNLARIRQIDAVWPGCCLASLGAYFSTIFRQKPMFGLRAEWAGYSSMANRQAIFRSAVREYEGFLSDTSQPITSLVSRREHDSYPKRGFLQDGDFGWPNATYVGNGAVQLGLPLVDAAVPAASGVA